MYLSNFLFLLRFCTGLMLASFFLQPTKSWAQHSSKINTALFRLLQQTPVEQQDSIELPVLVKGDLSKLPKWIAQEGGLYKYGVKTIASVQLSLHGIVRLLEYDAVSRVEFRPVKGHVLEHVEDSLMLWHN